ncbi:Isoprenylcysteine carboxyl methyltransferase [uncultured Pleomorphomonas sp.]|uniref:Isoprenylcysteine carboxyl methyltransferase n=1 Tax=uncultured Pleomorphomonas sp. TaxID=442121 RepID=A0A212LF75_9HYPH|nr:protein-S-isoprenylcysteine O-methyltransferase [uncultured Pleomorphomonas sp.]SCM76212.1 Isoprenylcysteine carboxyl methyltransferase [uncultured Pleomorphomonas sp.]
MTPSGRPMTTSLPAIATMVLAVVLLALALGRWRENGAGALVWLAAFLATVAIRTPYSLRNRHNRIVEASKGPADMLLLAGMFATMMVLPLLQLATGLFDAANYRLPAGAAWIGALLQIPYLWLFWRSHADLGRNWSPGLEVRESHELVTRGIYARIRHPMYAAIWLSALAQPLLVQNWIAGALVIPAFAAMWFIRVPNEEAMMRRTFGAAYDAYCAATGRLFPPLRG